MGECDIMQVFKQIIFLDKTYILAIIN